jgi:hypothetical protein
MELHCTGQASYQDFIFRTSAPTIQYPVFSVPGPYLLDSDGAKPFEAAVPLLRCLEQNRTEQNLFICHTSYTIQ